MLDYLEGKKLLDKYKIHSIDSKYVKDGNDAAAFAKGGRIALKLISNKAIHKSHAGLVNLNLESEKEIVSAFNDLARKGKKLKPYKILAQKMAQDGIEIIIGGNTDQQFGKMILVGLGGIYVETFKDVQLRLCPITRRDALHMISGLKSEKIITYDGQSTEKLVELLLKVSKMLTENKKVDNLDLNPVIMRRDSYDVVDIRINVV